MDLSIGFWQGRNRRGVGLARLTVTNDWHDWLWLLLTHSLTPQVSKTHWLPDSLTPFLPPSLTCSLTHLVLNQKPPNVPIGGHIAVLYHQLTPAMTDLKMDILLLRYLPHNLVLWHHPNKGPVYHLLVIIFTPAKAEGGSVQERSNSIFRHFHCFCSIL